MANSDSLMGLQTSLDVPLSESVDTATSMILPLGRSADRLRHFPETIYDLRAESHLTRFVKVLTGDAGANQVRKSAIMARLRSTLQGSRFSDLDRFYGPLFGIRRSASEVLSFDPRAGTATSEGWDQISAADASFRSRIEQLARALSYGATPTGMELVSEAILSVDCDIYESYIQADASYRTVQEIEDLYGPGFPGGFLSDMEDVSISDLEGYQLSRISGDERRVFTVQPKRRISQTEAYDLRRVLTRVRPADARFVIDYQGIPLHQAIPIEGMVADSEHWEIVRDIVPGVNDPFPLHNRPVDAPTFNYPSDETYPGVNLFPGPTLPVYMNERPKPPFTGYQGEAWSYNSDIIGVNASNEDIGTITVLPPQRVSFPNGEQMEFGPELSVLPRKLVQSGRAVSDGVLVSHPYPGVTGAPALYEDSLLADPNYGLAPLYMDGVPVSEIVKLLQSESIPSDPFHHNPENRYWVSGGRFGGDNVFEILEVRLTSDRLINYVTCEVSHFPHTMVMEVFVDGEWSEVYQHEIPDSFPRVIPTGADSSSRRQGHPEHAFPGHWIKVSARIPAVNGTRIRVRMNRLIDEFDPPVTLGRDEVGRRAEREIPYTLAVRSLDLGYRVSSRADFGTEPRAVISSTRDANGSQVQYRSRELPASNLLTDGYWRSEPQPVNYAVVNLYLDTRDAGDGQVIDRFYLEPTHVGCHLTIYSSMDPPETDGTDGFYESLTWTPIPRDYTLQKGFVHLPSTRARYWKFEFTNLATEVYESFLPITRQVRLFPRSLVEAMNRDYSRTAIEIPRDMLPWFDAVRESLYSDALNSLGVAANPYPLPNSAAYAATEAIYFPSLAQAAKARDASWVLGFTPWHQSDKAPRFPQRSVHFYENAEVTHSTKVAFFVGLREIRAYRTKWEESDNTPVYYDTLDDFRNLTPGFTWSFEPGYLTTGPSPVGVASVESRVFPSRSGVLGLQFATVQNDAVQLVPDPDFMDPALTIYDWSDNDYSSRVGDAQLIYSASDHSVINVRKVNAEATSIGSDAGPIHEIVHPVFSFEEYEAIDPDLTADAIGGQATAPVGISSEGRVYAAVRFTTLTSLTSPLILQIVKINTDETVTVLAAKAIEAGKGQTVEESLLYVISEPDLRIRARLVQVNKSDDAWKVLSLAIFEDSIIWEFSNNGGSTWQNAQAIRNNDRGVLTFPGPGTSLRYRARTSRKNQWISAIKIRPWYVGVQNARTEGTHRGPNISVYDSDIPIHEDPMFTAWTSPIPSWWTERRQTFQILPVDGTPNVTIYARFYGRPVNDTVTEPTDSASAIVIHIRTAEERLDYFYPISDSAVRVVNYSRSTPDLAQVSNDVATFIAMYGISKPIVSGIVKPVFSEKRDTP